MSTTRFRFTVAYDGTAYCGWQVQQNGPTVQGAIEEVLGRLTNDVVKLHGSGRTDSGVHARGQVAHCDLKNFTDGGVLMCALNALLPPDIRMIEVVAVSEAFHARKCAKGKQYRYQIWCGPVLPPHLSRYRTHVQCALDLERMQEAAQLLVGRHDFAAFTANSKSEVASTIRTLTRLDVTQEGHEMTVIAEGEGFLYKMVRSLAGWLLRVGEGTVSVAETIEVLESGFRTSHVPSAVPRGLSLWRVWYEEPAAPCAR